MKLFSLPESSNECSSKKISDLQTGFTPPSSDLRYRKDEGNATIQPKPKIGQPEDKYEQEADCIARQVTGQPMQPLSSAPQLQMKCKESPFAMASANKGETNASDTLYTKLQLTKGQGESLPENTRQELGKKMHGDFSGVRIHTDQNAAQMSQGIGALAFTHGNDIYFNQGKFNPASSSGKHLLAHELTHVMQQQNSHKKISSYPDIMCQEDAEVAPSNLEGALGYRSKLEAAAMDNSTWHPMSGGVINRIKALLEARLLKKERWYEEARALYESLAETMGNLRDSIHSIGLAAPNPTLWLNEEIAWNEILQKVEWGLSVAMYGPSYGEWDESFDELWMTVMARVNERLLNSLWSPYVGPATKFSPGGKVTQKIPLISLPIPPAPVPIAILNAYLNLEMERKDNTGNSITAVAATEVDAEGNLKPGISAELKSSGGSKVTGGLNQDGPSVAAESGKLEGGGLSLSGSAKMTKTGGEAVLKSHDPAGWTTELKATTGGGLSYKFAHSSGLGAELAGEIDKFSLKAMAPTATLGDTSIKWSVELEIIPAAHLWPQTYTQNAVVLEYFDTYSNIVLTLAALSIAVPVTIVSLEAMPVVTITLGSQAPRLLPVLAR